MNFLQTTPKWQLALIPILLLVLGGVLWNNFAGNSSEDFSDQRLQSDQPRTVETTAWKWGLRDTTFAHNPFQSLEVPVREKYAQSDLGNSNPAGEPYGASKPGNESQANNALQDLSAKPVTLLIRKGKKDIAIIGDQVIHSGQQLESGQKVKSINIDRILLSNPEG